MTDTTDATLACRFDAVGYRFRSLRGDVQALDGVGLGLEKGKFTFLLGPSGCGKTTVLRLAAGLITPTSGSIGYPGFAGKPKARLVFQDYGLFPWMTVLDNAAFGLRMDGVSKAPRRKKALDMLELMGIAAFASHYPYELSGGMRQRAAIARAFVTEPDILLMDEPFRALDAGTRLLLQGELEALWLERRSTILYVTHDIDEAILLGDRVLVMGGRPGRIIEDIGIDFARPRVNSETASVEREEIKWQLWDRLKAEVRAES
jgi:NitT/TauT family transport system ATP-binding protein